jgi:hypothetical protein
MRFSDYYNRNIEYILSDLSKLLPTQQSNIEEGEGIPLKNIVKDVSSDRNKKFFAIRKKDGNTGSIIKKLNWNNKAGHITLKYDVVATFDGGPYKIEIMLEDANKYLGNRKEFLALTNKEQVARFRKLTQKTTIKIHSNDPSFIWQGVWERAIKGNYNIKPLPSKNKFGKDIWKERHGNQDQFLTKHLMEAIQTIPFLTTKLVKMIKDKYK